MTPSGLFETRALEREQGEPEQTVLGALDERHGYAFSGLSHVVESEPLVGEVSAAVDHELGSEHAPERPARDERRHKGVGEGGERRAGPPASLQEKTDGRGESDAAEARDAALPDGDPTGRVTAVVAPVGGDVGHAGADETGDDEHDGELREGFDARVGRARSDAGRRGRLT